MLKDLRLNYMGGSCGLLSNIVSFLSNVHLEPCPVCALFVFWETTQSFFRNGYHVLQKYNNARPSAISIIKSINLIWSECQASVLNAHMLLWGCSCAHECSNALLGKKKKILLVLCTEPILSITSTALNQYYYICVNQIIQLRL